MKTYNTYFTNIESFKKFVISKNILDNDKLLIQIFTSNVNEDYIRNLLGEVTSIFPSSTIVGSTTDGEICEQKVSTGKTVVALSQFENTRLKSTLVENIDDDMELGRLLAKEIFDEETKAIITFADGLNINGEEYLNGIYSVAKDVVVAGGLSGDNAMFKTTYVFTNDRISSNGAVGVSLINSDLIVNNDYNFDWLPIGKTMKITKADKNRVYTIDNIKAYDIYEKFLGQDIAKGLPAVGIEFPLIIERDGETIARAVTSKDDDGSLSFAGDLCEGDLVRFAYGDAEVILNNSINSSKKIQNKAIETIFIYSCMARRRFMPYLIENEIKPYAHLTNTSGFFTYGEFYKTQSKNELLNQTMTLITLSESKKTVEYEEYKEEKLELSNYQKSLKALSHILNVTTKDLNNEYLLLAKENELINSKKESLMLAQEVGNFGSWELDLKTNKFIWSDKTYDIYKKDKNRFVPSIDKYLDVLLNGYKEKAFEILNNMEDGGIHTFEAKARRDDGVIIDILQNAKFIFDKDNKAIKIIGTVLDITKHNDTQKEMRKQERLLAFQNYYDKLTNLPNRNLFKEKIDGAIAKANDKKSEFALVIIDIDNFKNVNDTFGHDYGDKLLNSIVKRFLTSKGIIGTLSRLGGDEFGIIIEDFKNFEEISDISKDILELMKEKFNINSHDLYISVSIGISLYPKDSIQKDELLKFADSAMYKAKDEGKNNFQFYSEDLTAKIFEKVVLEANIRIGIQEGQFEVYYQPQTDGSNNKLNGMEALVRWNHPTMGLVSPDKFIPLAEETGLIIELDQYTMKKAMLDVASWYKDGLNPGVLALNLSTKQLKGINFISILKNIIKETNFNVKWLELEITESQMMKDPLQSIKKLQAISDMGIKIAIDDFGTGYSSLAYLKKLPVNKLKIDQSFVRELPYDEEDSAISKAVIALAKSLNLETIAEGVEEIEQKDFLVASGCTNIQGYYYSRPIPYAQMKEYLKNN